MTIRGSFTYANPPVIHWGAGCLAERLASELGRMGAQRVFLVTTRSVNRHPALGGALEQLLDGRCVGKYAGIGQHAPAHSVAEAVTQAREARPDALISFGGGSPIDAAKAVAFALATGLNLENPDAADRARDLASGDPAMLPHLAIPTTLSAAELSALAGFTTEAEREKVGLRGLGMLPAAVLYDAQLSMPTPLDLWLSSGIRAVDHAVETLLSERSQPHSDALSLEALRRLERGLLRTRKEPNDLDARTESQIGAWLSFSLPGVAAGGLCHTLGKRIGATHGIPHGVTSCLLLPHVMRYLAPRTAEAQARIADALQVSNAADGVSELIAALGQPQHLGAYGLSEADLEAAARPVASPEFPQDELVAVYRAAW